MIKDVSSMDNSKVKSNDNNFYDQSEVNLSIYNLTLLNLKYIAGNKKSLIQLSIFLLCSFTLPIIFIPVGMGMGISAIVYLVLPSLILMGNIGYDMRKSSLYKNIMLSGYKKRQFYLPSLITLFIIGIMLTMVYWPVMFIFGKLGWLMINWRQRGVAINLFTFDILLIFAYLITIQVFVTFSFYFLIHNTVSTIRVYYSIVMSIIILGVIFGGSLNTYFGHSVGLNDYESNFNLSKSFWSKVGDDSKVWIVFASDSYVSTLDYNYTLKGQAMAGGLFPGSMFIPTLFYPFYGVGQFATTGFNQEVFLEQYQHSYTMVIPDDIYYGDMSGLEILQWVYDGVLTGDADAIASAQSIKNAYPNGLGISNLLYLSFDKNRLPWTLVLIQPYLTVILYFIIGKSIIKFKEGV